TNIADEQRVASQNFLWLIRNRRIDHQQTNAFRCVARGFHKAQDQVPKFDFIAIFHSEMIELDTGLSTKDDSCSGSFCEFVMSTYKVGVQVCFDDVLDLELVYVCLVDVIVNVALRINNRSFSVRTNQIRSMSKTG